MKVLYLQHKKIISMKIGDKVLISPDLTKLPNWISGTVIEVENNPFVGINRG